MSEILDRYAFSARVLAVAVKGESGDFTVYVDAVPGLNHDLEQDLVAQHGSKLSRELSFILFPRLFGQYRWRD